MIGAILLSGLSTAFGHAVAASPEISPSVQQQVQERVSGGVAFVSEAEARAALQAAGVPTSDAQALLAEYRDAQIRALKGALACVALVGLLGFVASRRIQRHVLTASPAASG